MWAVARGILLSLLALGLVCLPAEAADLKTDRSKALIPLDEIISGGPPPDGIPAIDRPVFVAPGAADAWLKPVEPVLALQVNGDARAYPLQILIWHEIVNDTVGGRFVAVTYCPLCNSGLVFDRVVDGRTLDFGTSGKLYQSDLLMYDRQTHSLWAQMRRAVVGRRAGTSWRISQYDLSRRLQGHLPGRAGALSRDRAHALLRHESLPGVRPPGQHPVPVPGSA
jgi:hypothetical protein